MKYRKNYIIFIGILGTAFEWLEYSYYGYITTKISQLFFPNFDYRTGLLLTMGFFAAGFIMRPIGGIIFGFIGDKRGRKKALSISLFLMGFASLLMGAIPTYQTIGIYAPLLLLCCRLLQGLAVSGEHNGASIFLIEHSKNNYPNLAGSWVGTASALGMLLGAFAATIVSLPHMPEWAWRAPFFLAFISCIVANYLRYKMVESPVFLNAYRQQQIIKFPLKTVFSQYSKSFYYNMILAAFVSVNVYVSNVYFASYLVKDLHFSTSQSALIASIGEFFIVISFPFVALLADRIGHKIVMSIGFLSTLIATPLLFIFAKTKIISLIIMAQIFYGFTNSFACAPIFYFIYKLFPTPVRYTGNSTAWSFGVAIFGGTAPLIADYLLHRFSFYGPSFFVAIFAIMSLLVITKNMFVEFFVKKNGLLENL